MGTQLHPPKAAQQPSPIFSDINYLTYIELQMNFYVKHGYELAVKTHDHAPADCQTHDSLTTNDTNSATVYTSY